MPELRGAILRHRVFASRRTVTFDLLMAGVALAAIRRRPAYLLASIPWLRAVGVHLDLWPPGEWRATAGRLTRMATHQLVWLAGLATGSIEARRLVL
jgi:hypothetical protein